MGITEIVLIIAAVAAVATAGMAAYSAYEQGQAQQGLAKQQARQQRELAERERDEANFRATQQRKTNQRMLALQRVGYAASGVALDSGSPLATIGESAREAALQEQVIISGGDAASWDLLSRSSVTLFSGKVAKRAGNMGATSSLLRGASNVASIYGSYGGGYKAPSGGAINSQSYGYM